MVDIATDPIGYSRKVIGEDPLSTLLGIRVEEVRESYARASLAIREQHCNFAKRAHGGVLFSLADQAFAMAVHSRGIKGFALEIKINYFQGVEAGETVYAEATPMDIRTRVSLWQIDLTTESGERIATAQGLAYLLP
jgi:acyl-CoA thioesterase